MSDPSENGLPAKKVASDPLPPVQPPSAGFLLQLFVIPMVIVTIIVMVWLLLNWLAHMGGSPARLVNDLGRLNNASWQKALTLANLLQNPEYEEFKKDPEMAEKLSAILEEQLDAGSSETQPVQLRLFLCRALGEFHVPSVLPTLLRAAEQEKTPRDIDVRRAALEAIAVFSTHDETGSIADNENVMETLRAASRERSENLDEQVPRSELRSTAAYVLGVIGGSEARDRLALMVSDAYANARYNAGLGLARHGDLRAIPVLVEMLNPDNSESVENEEEGGRESKRLLVITNGIRGVAQLAESHSEEELSPLVVALQAIVDSELENFGPGARRGIRMNAEETLLVLRD